MPEPGPADARLPRRGLLQAASVGVLAAAVGSVDVATAVVRGGHRRSRPVAAPGPTVPFEGVHQAGITTRQQSFVEVTAFDIVGESRATLVALLDEWTHIARRLCAGVALNGTTHDGQPRDNGETAGLPPARLTLTVGFGPALVRRLGIRAPDALRPLPAFATDRLDPAWCDGDVLLQSCADDPQVSAHAVRTLAHAGRPAARLRWAQSGFLSRPVDGSTPRNLLGFRDGSANIDGRDVAALRRHVWVGTEAPSWLAGGTYAVTRRIELALAEWDASALGEQERVIGRHKADGAPFGARREADALPVQARGAGGHSVLPEHSHVRLASPELNDGVRLLRRGYNYTAGARDGQLQAGLMFVAFQRDPVRQFVNVQRRLAEHDALNEYTRHVGSALFAVRGGVGPGQSWAAGLFD